MERNGLTFKAGPLILAVLDGIPLERLVRLRLQVVHQGLERSLEVVPVGRLEVLLVGEGRLLAVQEADVLLVGRESVLVVRRSGHDELQTILERERDRDELALIHMRASGNVQAGQPNDHWRFDSVVVVVVGVP